ncbi:MAG: hypothetical protein B0W54_12890 [Cellvibrio sp. 79]|nr:MAG: hypothetical protein B0W54_12890 [Cellvibrio sp. 79]
MSAPADVHLKGELVLAAILQSFHKNETILSLHQLILRRLTPSEAMSRHYINLLLHLGLVKASSLFDEPGIFLSIRGGKSYFTVVPATAEPTSVLNWKAPAMNHHAAQTSLLEIIFELLAANLVEYVRYFANKERLNIEEIDYKSPSLRIFFENISLSQAFMLFWRAIKKSAEVRPRTIKFHEIVELAYQFFEHYCALGKEIKPYPRPRSMGQSRLEKVIFYDILRIRCDPDLLPNIHEYLYERSERHSIVQRDLDLNYFATPFEDR